MEPTIKDGVLVVTEVTYDQPSYIKVTTIDGVHHRDDADTGPQCWVNYGGHEILVHGSAATVRALVWQVQRDALLMADVRVVTLRGLGRVIIQDQAT